MKSIAFIRLHQFFINEDPSFVFDRIARHVDGLFFLTHNVRDPRVMQLAGSHPKTIDIRPGRPVWRNHMSILDCVRWADEIKPDFVHLFDEDEIPPDRFDREFWKFRQLDAGSIAMKCVWVWDSLNMILAERAYMFGWHMKTYRWRESLATGGMIKFNFLKNIAKEPIIRCPFPYRHAPLLTRNMREERAATRGDRTPWWMMKDDWLLTSYDPDMTWTEFIRLSHETETTNEQGGPGQWDSMSKNL